MLPRASFCYNCRNRFVMEADMSMVKLGIAAFLAALLLYASAPARAQQTQTQQQAQTHMGGTAQSAPAPALAPSPQSGEPALAAAQHMAAMSQQGQQSQQPVPQPALPYLSAPQPAKLSTKDRLGALGGLLMDADGSFGSGNFAAAQAQNQAMLNAANAQNQRAHQQQLFMGMIGVGPQAARTAPTVYGQNLPANVPAGQSGVVTQQQLQYASVLSSLYGIHGPLNNLIAQQQAAQTRIREQQEYQQRLAHGLSIGMSQIEATAYANAPDEWANNMSEQLATQYSSQNLAPGVLRDYGRGNSAYNIYNPDFAAQEEADACTNGPNSAACAGADSLERARLRP